MRQNRPKPMCFLLRETPTGAVPLSAAIRKPSANENRSIAVGSTEALQDRNVAACYWQHSSEALLSGAISAEAGIFGELSKAK